MNEQHTIHFSSISIKVCCKASWGIWGVSPCKETDDTLQNMKSTKKRWRKTTARISWLSWDASSPRGPFWLIHSCWVFLKLEVNTWQLDLCVGILMFVQKNEGGVNILPILLHRLLLQSISQTGRHKDGEWHALVQSGHWSESCGQWESSLASQWAATPHYSIILIQLQERLPGNRICLWEQSTSLGGNMRHCNGYIKMWETLHDTLSGKKVQKLYL